MPYGVLVRKMKGCTPSVRVGVFVGATVGVNGTVGDGVGVCVFVGVLDGIGVAEGACVFVCVGASRVSVGVRGSVALAGGLNQPSILDPKFWPMSVNCGIRITSKNKMMIDKLTNQTFLLYNTRFQFG